MVLEQRIIPASQAQLTTKLQPVREVLKTAKVIVLMDLDGTIIDENYAISNLEGLKQKIGQLQEAGVLVGLHSDTPRTSLLQFAQMYGIQGPLIYEMAGIHLPEFNLDIVLDPSEKDFFTALREKLYEAAKTSFVDTEDIKHLISRERDKNKEKREVSVYPGYQYGLFINPFREFSLGFWIERYDTDGTPFVDPDFHQRVNDLVASVLARDFPNLQNNSLYFYQNPIDDGTSIVRPAHLHTKTPPIQTLLTIGDYQGPVYMIGNTKSDFISDKRVTTLGVGNSDHALIELIVNDGRILPTGINRISQGKFVDGVIEHLNAILSSL